MKQGIPRITTTLLLLLLTPGTSAFWNKLVGKVDDNGIGDNDSGKENPVLDNDRENVVDKINVGGTDVKKRSAHKKNGKAGQHKDIPFGHIVPPGSDFIPTNDRTLKSIIREEQRFVVYNSRRLQGECLPICEETSPPSKAPVAPTRSPVNPTRSPVNPTASPVYPTRSPVNPTRSPVNPTRSPVNPTPQPVYPTRSPVNPTRSPVNPTPHPVYPTRSPVTVTPPPTNAAPTPIDRNCDTLLKNLGFGYSEATGRNAHDECWPAINQLPGPTKRDDSANIFVGGNARVINAAEAEGKVIVMGNLHIESKGWGDIGFVGAGYHVNVNDGQDCLVVGGDITTATGVRVGGGEHNYGYAKCNLRYTGSSDGSVSRFGTTYPGQKYHQPNMDMSQYEYQKQKLYEKSKYWASLPQTSYATYSSGTFKCSSATDVVQVFNLNGLGSVGSWKFDNSCKDKTVLVNVKGSGYLHMPSPVVYLGSQSSPWAKECHFKTNILWNFPDALTVDISGSSEFIGAVLVTGNLNVYTPGFSGRVMVLGDLVHNKAGSEFHAMEFNPPIPLPDLNCDVYPTPLPTYPPPPTKAPTKKPVEQTNFPPESGCVPIPYCSAEPDFPKCLPQSISKPNPNDCKECDGGRSWDPCAGRGGKQVCYGDGCVLSGP